MLFSLLTAPNQSLPVVHCCQYVKALVAQNKISAPIKAKISSYHRYSEERPEIKNAIETNAKMNNYKEISTGPRSIYNHRFAAAVGADPEKNSYRRKGRRNCVRARKYKKKEGVHIAHRPSARPPPKSNPE